MVLFQWPTLAFAKQVVARFTFDYWKTTSGVVAEYIDGQKGTHADGWKELFPVLETWIVAIFNASLRLSHVHSAFRVARILPLRKPGKADHTQPKAYRPISLLSTLGKILELVMARRLSFWAETHGLLPNNQFGARPRRSCEQAINAAFDNHDIAMCLVQMC